MPCSSLPIQLYLVDTFTYAASALAAASVSSNTTYYACSTRLIYDFPRQVFRSMLGFAFPLFGAQMYAALGNGGGNSLLAGLAIILGIPFPVWLWFHGEKIRLRSKLSRTM